MAWNLINVAACVVSWMACIDSNLFNARTSHDFNLMADYALKRPQDDQIACL
jgi:hypothetical protein